MKKSVLTAILSIGFFLPAAAQDMTGEEIIQKANDIMNPPQMQAVMTMIIITSSGEERTFVYESFAMNHGEKTLMRYLEPSRSRGQAILMEDHSNRITMYFPSTKRVRHLAEHARRQKMEGSDFAYEDMGGGDAFITDYDTKRLQDDKKMDTDCYTLELIRKEGSDAGYSRLLMWLDKSNFVPLLMDYYDRKDPELHIKRLFVSDIEVIQGIPTAKRMVMWNMLDNSKTTMMINSVDYEVNLDEDLFTERGLRE